MNKSNCDWFYHHLLIIHTFAVTYNDNDVIRYSAINDDFKVLSLPKEHRRLSICAINLIESLYLIHNDNIVREIFSQY